jgi:class 3 adenylate cyclase/two-component SAPR family response regulator/tetratricopeptide (TPR) repeat protein
MSSQAPALPTNASYNVSAPFGWPVAKKPRLAMKQFEFTTSGLDLKPGERIVAVAHSTPGSGASRDVVEVKLLGRFAATVGDRSIGQWPRPSARRLCQLVLVSPGRRISRGLACEALFPSLSPVAAARQLYRVQWLARQALKELGQEAAGLLRADPTQIWANPSLALVVDLDAHEQALHAALRASPGPGRDAALAAVLSTRGIPLEDEPQAAWAATVRDRVEYLRQEARLELARDRSRGVGAAHAEEVLQAWQACLESDPTDEEAVATLMQLHIARGRRPLAVAVYERCRDALAKLGMKTSPALEEVLASAHGRVPGPSRGDRPAGAGCAVVGNGDERRLVSVVFVELVPAGLGSQVDPEDLRELITVGLAQVMSEVEAFGGTVASISGFGMSVLFGAPQSHEDDPERALRAALRIAAAIGGSATDTVSGRGGVQTGAPLAALSVRIGVESGTAVVGPIGDGDQRRYQAVGGVVAVAGALQSAAKPGTVLVGPATRAAADEIFEWGPNREIPVPSGAGPIIGSYLVGARPRGLAEAGRRRLAARAPLVGRAVELAVLTAAVRTAVAGSGGAVAMVGEPGLGKTRLVAECRKFFMGWVGAASGRLPLWLEGRCASYASSTPFGAYQQLMCRFIGVPLEADEAVLRPALESAVRAVMGKDSDVLPVLAQMLGVGPGLEGARLARMGPAELQHVTFVAVRSLLANLVSRGPTVLALEDLHWSDPTSLRLTAELASLASNGPLLLLLTRRPEPDPGVGDMETSLGRSLGIGLRALELVPLQRADERSLARSLVGGDVNDEIVDAISEGVDGNPLFLEERVASLLATGALRRNADGWRLAGGGTTLVPEALERLIRAHADRLSLPAREVMAAASVLGHEVERSALGVVSELGTRMDDAVAEVVSAGLLTEVHGRTEPRYRFRHGLIREATYGDLLRSQRRQLHARAAWDLETRSTGRLDEVAAVLGGHFALAGQADRAAYYLHLAGDRAARIFANDEAIGLYREALAAIDGAGTEVGAGELVGVHTRIASAVALCEKLGAVLALIDRFDEARAAVLDGLARTPVENTVLAARLHCLLANIEGQDLHLGAKEEALEAAEKLIGPCGLDDEQERIDVWLAVQIDKAYCATAISNDFERSSSILASVRPLVDARGTPGAVADFYMRLSLQNIVEQRYRVDAKIVEEHRRAAKAAQEVEGTRWDLVRPDTIRSTTMLNLGVALTWYGDLDGARQVHEQMLADAAKVGTQNGRSMALTELAVTAWRGGDVELVRELAPQARAAAVTGFNWYYVTAATAALEAWVAWRDHRAEQVFALATEALDLWRSHLASYPFRCLALFPLCSAYLDRGQAEKAVDLAREALEPKQARLPDELEAAVQAACAAWDRGEPEHASRLVDEAVALARELRYA